MGRGPIYDIYDSIYAVLDKIADVTHSRWRNSNEYSPIDVNSNWNANVRKPRYSTCLITCACLSVMEVTRTAKTMYGRVKRFAIIIISFLSCWNYVWNWTFDRPAGPSEKLNSLQLLCSFFCIRYKKVKLSDNPALQYERLFLKSPNSLVMRYLFWMPIITRISIVEAIKPLFSNFKIVQWCNECLATIVSKNMRNFHDMKKPVKLRYLIKFSSELSLTDLINSSINYSMPMLRWPVYRA